MFQIHTHSLTHTAPCIVLPLVPLQAPGRPGTVAAAAGAAERAAERAAMVAGAAAAPRDSLRQRQQAAVQRAHSWAWTAGQSMCALSACSRGTGLGTAPIARVNAAQPWPFANGCLYGREAGSAPTPSLAM